MADKRISDLDIGADPRTTATEWWIEKAGEGSVRVPDISAHPNTSPLACDTIVTPAPGQWFTTPLKDYQAPVVQTLNRESCTPFFLEETIIIDQIAVEVATTGGVTATVRLGLRQWDYANGLPGDLIIDCGTLNTATGQATGLRGFGGLNLTFPPGTYTTSFTAQGTNGATPTYRQMNQPGFSVGKGATPVAGGNWLYNPVRTGVPGALPFSGSAVGTSSLAVSGPLVWLQRKP